MKPVPSQGRRLLEVKELIWKAADRLRGDMDAAEYRYVVLGLLYLRCLSAMFEDARRRLGENFVDDPYVCEGDGLRWVPEAARWDWLSERMGEPGCPAGEVLDEALRAVSRSNRDLRKVFPDGLGLTGRVEDRRVLELFALFGDGRIVGHGDRPPQDGAGESYEYFLRSLDEFARIEGKRGAEFHTPGSVAKLLVEILEPYEGRVYDPCCGAGGLLVQAQRFVVTHKGREHAEDLDIYGQEINQRSWQLAKMNLDLHGTVLSGLDDHWADTFAEDRWPGLEADFVMAVPPFNMSDWAHREHDLRWRYGVPPARNANFAWLQHVVSKLNDRGSAGVVLANGSLSSKQLGEDRIRAAMVEDDLVACVIALPDRLFRSAGIPACVWFLTKDKSARHTGDLADRRGEVLFLDARGMGQMIGRAERVLTEADLQDIAGTYRAWRGTGTSEEYRDVPGFCRSVTRDEIREHRHILNPGRYVGSADNAEERGESSAQGRVDELTREFLELLEEAERMEREMRGHLGA
ncbi:type I restriction-modification system subunit M [Streptomyces beigongshangae]|uniref:type I restriction-modification system subunit M n=1 Tax=Streptomyces beigongshangae TaxID=2841597 RepID=UPI001C85AE4D|nr:type I restriction-modification system subunit M [Streptomyces sp. REN17]